MKCPTCNGGGVVGTRKQITVLGLFPLWDGVTYQQFARSGGVGESAEAV